MQIVCCRLHSLNLGLGQDSVEIDIGHVIVES